MNKPLGWGRSGNYDPLFGQQCQSIRANAAEKLTKRIQPATIKSDDVAIWGLPSFSTTTLKTSALIDLGRNTLRGTTDQDDQDPQA